MNTGTNTANSIFLYSALASVYLLHIQYSRMLQNWTLPIPPGISQNCLTDLSDCGCTEARSQSKVGVQLLHPEVLNLERPDLSTFSSFIF